MQGLCVFKAEVVGGGILSATIPAATLVVKCSAWCMLSLNRMCRHVPR